MGFNVQILDAVVFCRDLEGQRVVAIDSVARRAKVDEIGDLVRRLGDDDTRMVALRSKNAGRDRAQIAVARDVDRSSRTGPSFNAAIPPATPKSPVWEGPIATQRGCIRPRPRSITRLSVERG